MWADDVFTSTVLIFHKEHLFYNRTYFLLEFSERGIQPCPKQHYLFAFSSLVASAYLLKENMVPHQAPAARAYHDHRFWAIISTCCSCQVIEIKRWRRWIFKELVETFGIFLFVCCWYIFVKAKAEQSTLLKRLNGRGFESDALRAKNSVLWCVAVGIWKQVPCYRELHFWCRESDAWTKKYLPIRGDLLFLMLISSNMS